MSRHKNGHEERNTPTLPDQPETATIRKQSRRQQKRLGLALSKQFQPHFWQDADSRIAVVRTIRKRVELMKAHAGGEESYQREILCQRAVFVAILLETQETKAAEGEPLDLGSYVQAVNCLTGLLKSLGLEKRIKHAGGLKAYLDGKENNS